MTAILEVTERRLAAFDCNPLYGPCCGITRLERWERAKTFNLNPPEDLPALLWLPGVNSLSIHDRKISDLTGVKVCTTAPAAVWRPKK